MRIFFTLLTIFIHSITAAQNVNFKWAKQMGGANQDAAYSVAVDANGNVYSTGYFIDTADFDPSQGYYQLTGPPYLKHGCFISKLDSSGNFVWAKQFDGICTGYSLVLDSKANVYIGGVFSDTVDFDPGTGVYKLNDSKSNYFIAKLDSAGSFKWAIQKAGSYDNIAIDAAANIYYDGGKVDSSGKILWSKYIPTAVHSLALDDSANVYYTGRFRYTIDFDPGSGTYNITSTKDKNGNTTDDIFVCKLDSGGNFIWAKKIGGIDNDEANSITVDKQGNIYYLAKFADTVDFDPGTSVYNMTGLMAISKLSSDGNFIWAKSYKGNKYGSDISGFAITHDFASNVFITGYYRDSADFDPSSNVYMLKSKYGGYFLSKLDSEANFIWAKNINVGSASIVIDSANNLYTFGAFSGKTDFDPSIDTFNMTGIGDIYIRKMSPCSPSSSTINITACGQYKIRYYTYTQSGTYYETIPNLKGCDSIITLNLTIKANSGVALFEKACNSYIFKGNIIINTGVYYDTLTNSIGCDSIVTLNLTINNSSSSTVYDQGCNRYYLNKKLLTVSGTYYDTIPNAAGCDSVITLYLTINKSSVYTFSKSDCKSYIFNGDTLSQSGAYTNILTNAVGCDSVVVLYLTIYTSNNTNTLHITYCDTYTFKGNKLTASGVYYDTIPIAGACDSIIILNLKINKSVSTSPNIVSCDSYNFNGKLLTTSGIYYDTLSTSNGCDSIITLNLKINVVDASVTQNGKILIANANNAVYQWLYCSNGYTAIPNEVSKSFTPTITGAYAVAVVENNCSDTSNCYTVISQGISDKSISYTFDVFPNPTNGQFTVHSNQTLKNATLKLYNITGQVILQKTNLSGDSFVLNISEQANGIYMLEIGEGVNVSRVKIVKQ